MDGSKGDPFKTAREKMSENERIGYFNPNDDKKGKVADKGKTKPKGGTGSTTKSKAK